MQCLDQTESAAAAAIVAMIRGEELAWPGTVLHEGKTQETIKGLLLGRLGNTSECLKAWALEADRPGLCGLGYDIQPLQALVSGNVKWDY